MLLLQRQTNKKKRFSSGLRQTNNPTDTSFRPANIKDPLAQNERKQFASIFKTLSVSQLSGCRLTVVPGRSGAYDQAAPALLATAGKMLLVMADLMR